MQTVNWLKAATIATKNLPISEERGYKIQKKNSYALQENI